MKPDQPNSPDPFPPEPFPSRNRGNGLDNSPDLSFDHKPADQDFSREINIAVRILANTDPSPQEDLPMAIHRAGVRDWNLAVLLASLVPICCGREMLMMTGMYLAPEFWIWDQESKETVKRRFREDPLYCQIQELLPTLMKDASERQLHNLLDRSSEVNAVRQHQAEGARVSDLFMAPPILMVGPPVVRKAPGRRPPVGRSTPPQRSKPHSSGWLIALILAGISLPLIMCAGLVFTRTMLFRLPAKSIPVKPPPSPNPVQRPKDSERLFRKGQPVEPGMIALLPQGKRMLEVVILRKVDDERVEIGRIGWSSNWNQVIPISRLQEKPAGESKK